MDIRLIQQIPLNDGSYLVKFSETSRLHFVLVQTVSGQRDIVTDTGKKLYFNEFPDKAYWSESITGVIL